MSLKEESRGIFTKYGLTDEEINVYLIYLGNPQTTISFVSELGEIKYENVKVITEKLLSEGFIKEIKTDVGISRFLPLEPYLKLSVKESSVFRDEIEKIKDSVLEDQSKRFKELEEISSTATNSVNEAVENQVDDFFKISDEHNADKKTVIETARDRFKSETKTLESDIHSIIDSSYTELDSDIKQMDADAAKLWDENSAKFTKDNNDLNSTLDGISDSHVSHTSALEANLHSVADNLNTQLKTIADGFISKYEGGITESKENINKIISDLLKDFAERVKNLENLMKKDLDEHVENHKENAQALKPSLEEILAKYMARMNDVVEELKRSITKLLFEHIDHLKSTTGKMEKNLTGKVTARQTELVDQVKSFEGNTVVLIDNLSEISGKLTDLSEALASRGSSFKALLLGKHKIWVALRDEIQERVTKLSSSIKEDFEASTSDYIKNTNSTKDSLNGEISKILTDENSSLKGETDTLDKKAQDKVNAELEGLASDLSTQIDDVLKKNIEHCKDTTMKLKDTVQSNFSTHKSDYDNAINRHLKNSLDHYNDCDRDVKNNVDGWYGEMDKDHLKAKNDVTTETSAQNADIEKHLAETKDKNVEHSKTFETDTESTKKTQTEIYTKRLEKVRSDFDNSKKETSEKIDNEISLFEKECQETDDKISAMLEDHKTKYKENATTLNESLNKTVEDNTQNTKDAIADFTLQFMNAIDEGTELAEETEEKLDDIAKASTSITDVPVATTWHAIGMPAIIETITEALTKVKSSVIVVTHEVVPKILETLSQVAYKKKSARFFYTTHFTPEFQPILQKMKTLGNIQFRQLKVKGEFIAMTRDAELVVLAPVSNKKEDLIGIVSTQDGYAKLYSQIIGPVFQANSRPV